MNGFRTGETAPILPSNARYRGACAISCLTSTAACRAWTIVGLDVSHRMLEIARERLHLDRLPATQEARLTLMQGALTYRDKRLTGYDAAAVVEVIEHLDPPRLAAFERVLFEFARPVTVVMTTPNAEYNVKFEALPVVYG